MQKKLKLFLKVLINKKAITTTTFSWMFMIIIGGILIMFTYSILQGYWAVEKETQDLEFAKALTHTFHIKAQSLGVQSATVFDTFEILSQKDVELQCISQEFLRFNIDNKDVNYEPLNIYLDSFSIFMPHLVDEETNSLFIIQEDFNFPQAITPLIAIVPKHHIIVVNKSSEMYEIVKKTLSTKKSYKQLSFIIYDELQTPELFLDSLKEYNPSSIQFVNFDSSFLFYLNRYDNNNEIEISHINIDFQLLPSYLNPSNERKEVSGQIQYTYSNQKKDYSLTNQENSSKISKSFTFYGVNDETSLILFSLFSSPNTFECSYNNLIKRVGFNYEISKHKISQILQEKNNLNATFCKSNLNSQILQNFYEVLNESFHKLYTNQTHNVFTQNNMNTFLEISLLEEVHKELKKESCELIY